VDYCSSVVWQVGSFGGLVESSDHNSMLCGRVSNPVDGLLVACHGELRWVQLRCFGTRYGFMCMLG
jgi:hypothetical protein